jgi:excisionase family DNA binding protein
MQKTQKGLAEMHPASPNQTNITMTLQECQPLTLSTSEAAKLLGCGRSTVERGIADGKIPGTKVGNRWFVFREQFMRMVAGEQPQAVDVDAVADAVISRLGELFSVAFQPKAVAQSTEVRPRKRVA